MCQCKLVVNIKKGVDIVAIHDLFAQNSREKKNFFTKSDVKVRVPPRKAKRLLKG